MVLGRNKREKIAFSIYKLLLISAMTKENEDVSVVNKSSYTEEEIKAVYEKGKSEGRNFARQGGRVHQCERYRRK